MLTIGKLYGVMHATAPTGWRRAIAPIRPPGASAVCGISIGGSGMTFDSSAYARSTCRSAPPPAAPASACRRVAVQPVSAITTGSRSSKWSRIASAVFCSSSARTSGEVCDQAGNASCAARAASLRLRGRRLGRDADDLFGRGVDDLVAAVGAVDPLPADQQLAVMFAHGGESSNAFHSWLAEHSARMYASISVVASATALDQSTWTAAGPARAARVVAGARSRSATRAIWFPEAVGRDALVASTLLLDATERIVAATGIVSLYARDPLALNAAWHTIEAAFPGRFVLGIGVSHEPMVEGLVGTTDTARRSRRCARTSTRWTRRRSSRRRRRDPPRRVLAALGPKMLALAAEHADGAHPYNVTPEHTKVARDVLGPGKLLAVEQKAVLTTDATEARDTVARQTLAIYLTPAELREQLEAARLRRRRLRRRRQRPVPRRDGRVGRRSRDPQARCHEHRDAGADHVCVQVVGATDPLDAWRRLAPRLLNRASESGPGER